VFLEPSYFSFCFVLVELFFVLVDVFGVVEKLPDLNPPELLLEELLLLEEVDGFEGVLLLKLPDLKPPEDALLLVLPLGAAQAVVVLIPLPARAKLSSVNPAKTKLKVKIKVNSKKRFFLISHTPKKYPNQ